MLRPTPPPRPTSPRPSRVPPDGFSPPPRVPRRRGFARTSPPRPSPRPSPRTRRDGTRPRFDSPSPSPPARAHTPSPRRRDAPRTTPRRIRTPRRRNRSGRQTPRRRRARPRDVRRVSFVPPPRRRVGRRASLPPRRGAPLRVLIPPREPATPTRRRESRDGVVTRETPQPPREPRTGPTRHRPTRPSLSDDPTRPSLRDDPTRRLLRASRRASARARASPSRVVSPLRVARARRRADVRVRVRASRAPPPPPRRARRIPTSVVVPPSRVSREIPHPRLFASPPIATKFVASPPPPPPRDASPSEAPSPPLPSRVPTREVLPAPTTTLPRAIFYPPQSRLGDSPRRSRRVRIRDATPRWTREVRAFRSRASPRAPRRVVSRVSVRGAVPRERRAPSSVASAASFSRASISARSRSSCAETDANRSPSATYLVRIARRSSSDAVRRAAASRASRSASRRRRSDFPTRRSSAIRATNQTPRATARRFQLRARRAIRRAHATLALGDTDGVAGDVATPVSRGPSRQRVDGVPVRNRTCRTSEFRIPKPGGVGTNRNRRRHWRRDERRKRCAPAAYRAKRAVEATEDAEVEDAEAEMDDAEAFASPVSRRRRPSRASRSVGPRIVGGEISSTRSRGGEGSAAGWEKANEARGDRSGAAAATSPAATSSAATSSAAASSAEASSAAPAVRGRDPDPDPDPASSGRSSAAFDGGALAGEASSRGRRGMSGGVSNLARARGARSWPEDGGADCRARAPPRRSDSTSASMISRARETRRTPPSMARQRAGDTGDQPPPRRSSPRERARRTRPRALEVGGRRRPVRAGRHGRVERPRLRRGRALAERRGCARRGRAHVRAGGLEIPAEGSTPGPARHGDPRDAPQCGFAIRRRGRGKAIDRRLRSGPRAHVRENAESRDCSSREFRNLPRGVPPRRLLLHGGIPLARFLLRTPAREPSCSPQRPRHFLRARDHDDHMATSLTLPFLSFSGIKLVPVRYARVASRTRVSLHASTLVPRPC